MQSETLKNSLKLFARDLHLLMGIVGGALPPSQASTLLIDAGLVDEAGATTKGKMALERFYELANLLDLPPA